MPCLIAVLAVMFPRFGSILIWVARPNLFMAAFNGRYIWPILGIIFLPFTTLVYVILWSPGVSMGSGVFGLNGWDILWLAVAVLVDITHFGTQTYKNRDFIPTRTPSGNTPYGSPPLY
jgi:hypothetical protein